MRLEANSFEMLYLKVL